MHSPGTKTSATGQPEAAAAAEEVGPTVGPEWLTQEPQQDFTSRSISSIWFCSIWSTHVELCACTSDREHSTRMSEAFTGHKRKPGLVSVWTQPEPIGAGESNIWHNAGMSVITSRAFQQSACQLHAYWLVTAWAHNSNSIITALIKCHEI